MGHLSGQGLKFSDLTILSFIPGLLSSSGIAIPDMVAFLLCTMVSRAIPIIIMSWIPDFSSFHFTVKMQKLEVEIVLCTWYINILSC